ncbi:MAG TPA: trehalase-like domain-containing protein, partial [Woeseiaceae bacterium]|nr:trehalase-like domain-containing protein [Woeseiaceae bacterium]
MAIRREESVPDEAQASEAAYPAIEDYAAIGDGRTVALVSRGGSIDWLCLPHFSGPPMFAALLDRRRGGCFALRPTEPFRTRRRYLPDTNVLETSFETGHGRCVLTDCMVLRPDRRNSHELRPRAEILRRVGGCEGELELEVLCDARPDFGRARGRFEDRGALGWA